MKEFIKQHPILSYSILFFLIASWAALFFKPFDEEKLLERSKEIILSKNANEKVKDVLNLNNGAIVTLTPNRFYSIDLKMKAKNDYTIEGIERSFSGRFVKGRSIDLYLESDSVYYFFRSSTDPEIRPIGKQELSGIKIEDFRTLTIMDENAVYFKAITDTSTNAILRIGKDGDYEVYFLEERLLRQVQFPRLSYASCNGDELSIIKHKFYPDRVHFNLFKSNSDLKISKLPTDSFAIKLPDSISIRKSLKQVSSRLFVLIDETGKRQKNFRIDLNKNTTSPLLRNGLQNYKVENTFFFNGNLCLSVCKNDTAERRIFQVDTVGLTELTSFNLKVPDLLIQGIYKVHESYIGVFSQSKRRFQYPVDQDEDEFQYVFRIGRSVTITEQSLSAEINSHERLLDDRMIVINDTLYGLYENISDSGGYVIKKIFDKDIKKHTLSGGNKGYFSKMHLAGNHIIAELRYGLGFIKLNVNTTDLLSFKDADVYANIDLKKYEFEKPNVRYNSVLIIIFIVFIIILYILGYVIINDYVKNLEEDEHIKGLKKFFEIYPTLNYKLKELDRTLNKLRTRSDAMLLLGIVIGVFGVGAFLIFIQKDDYDASDSWRVKEVKSLVSPIVLLIFIETLSFFFLRQYRLIYNDYKAYYKVFLKVCNYFHILELSNLSQGEKKKIVISPETFKDINKTFLEEKFDLSAEDTKDVSIAGEEIIKKLIDKLPTG